MLDETCLAVIDALDVEVTNLQITRNARLNDKGKILRTSLYLVLALSCHQFIHFCYVNVLVYNDTVWSLRCWLSCPASKGLFDGVHVEHLCWLPYSYAIYTHKNCVWGKIINLELILII